MNKTSSWCILKKITLFSVPLMLSGLLQQLFHWVDALIVGNFIGELALASVGATTALYNLLVTILVGFTGGLAVLFARQLGEGKQQDNARLLAVYAVLLTAVFAVLAALGMVSAAFVLRWMDTPEVLMVDAKSYLCVILAGIPFLALYNIYSAVLRGMGNSTTPFVSVLLSSVINAGLDYVFVAILSFGVAGAAAATVLSQVVMTLYLVRYTVKKHPELRFSRKDIRRCGRVCAAGGRYGLPPAVQSSVSSLGDLLLQRFMNGFGEATVAAITTAYRVDSVLLLPVINFSTAISVLVAQESGAGEAQMAQRIFKLGTAVMAVVSLLLTAVVLLTGKPLLAMFGLTEEAVRIGTDFFRALASFYLIYGLSMSIKGYLEGRSDMLFSGAIGIGSLGVRILCSYLFVGLWGNRVIAYAEAISWVFLLVVFWVRSRIKWRS